MKAITLHQPFASLIAFGDKQIETRSWPTNYRGPIAIHAGKLSQDRAMECCEEPYCGLLKAHGIKVIGDLPWGAVIATARLSDCIKMGDARGDDWLNALIWRNPNEYDLGNYAPGRYAWVLTDVQPLAEPIPTRGYQGLWDFDDSQIGAAR